MPERLRTRFDRFLERPGTTVDLRPIRKMLPEIETYGQRLSGSSDAELTEAARELRSSSDPGWVAICALGREAAERALGERPFDVQLLGAMVMLSGHVAEMATGEGKTLTATIAAFGHVLRGEPVHVLTVNDYLARRDAEWMAPVYERLGVSVGWVGEGSTPTERRDAYARDVTYASVSEAGYDFLRDERCVDPAERVQRSLATVIVDEADSILIDEARVPLVLAGGGDTEPDPQRIAARLVRGLRAGRHYKKAQDGRTVELTDKGLSTVEAKLGVDLYAPENLSWLSTVNAALHAEVLLRRDVEYIVRGGRVDLVDEYRGRVAQRRRWPDGLQSAVEAKEGLDATVEGEVLGSITVQALIGLYTTACGMTATAARVGDQLREFYRLEVAVIPPNVPCVREDEPDRVYASSEEKEAALIEEVAAAHSAGRPVLIGTLDVAESERLAAGLRATDVPCTVLNAKHDAEEAAIIAEAGTIGAVTVSTQMAGRGTDIRLGGAAGRVDQAAHDEVAALGGLYVIGSGRHDSRRVDNQLRGRAGRQGDPGASVFYVSVADELVTRHREHPMPTMQHVDRDGRVSDRPVHRAIEQAQRTAEALTFEIHRNTWRYNVLIERQRQDLSARRDELLTTDAAASLLAARCPERYAEVCDDVGADVVITAARSIALYHLDRRWADHLGYLAEVRDAVHLRAVAHLDPLDEFHREAVPAFRQLLSDIDDLTVETFAEVEITGPEWTIADAGLIRPTATWTYMVLDNPFGAQTELAAALARWVRGRR